MLVKVNTLQRKQAQLPQMAVSGMAVCNGTKRRGLVPSLRFPPLLFLNDGLGSVKRYKSVRFT